MISTWVGILRGIETVAIVVMLGAAIGVAMIGVEAVVAGMTIVVQGDQRVAVLRATTVGPIAIIAMRAELADAMIVAAQIEAEMTGVGITGATIGAATIAPAAAHRQMTP
jgi:hypothetical protein